MPISEYAIAVGHNNTGGLVNFETYFSYPPRSPEPISRGSSTLEMINGYIRRDGALRHDLVFDGCPHSELDAYITAIFSGWFGTDNVDITLKAMAADNNFYSYNATAHFPVRGEHYTLNTRSEILGLNLPFTLVSTTPI